MIKFVNFALSFTSLLTCSFTEELCRACAGRGSKKMAAANRERCWDERGEHGPRL